VTKYLENFLALFDIVEIFL